MAGFITVTATVCLLATSTLGASEHDAKEGDPGVTCEEVHVVDSDQVPELTLFGCMMSQPHIAAWFSQRYNVRYWLAGYKCRLGPKEGSA